MKKRILVYGDSNTWGDKGLYHGRFDHDQQWPNILSNALGNNYTVLQEGLCGRIAGDHDEIDVHRNGRIGYEIALRVASPVDYVIIALGTNDAKDKYGLSIDMIADDLCWYQNRTLRYVDENSSEMTQVPKMIYVGAANFRNNIHFDPQKNFSDDLNRVLVAKGLDVVIPNTLEHGDDGLHYSIADHQKVAQMVHDKLKEFGE